MVWIGIGIGVGVGIGALVILAFWLGQRSVTVTRNESQETVGTPSVVTPQPFDAPETIKLTKAEETTSSPEPDAVPTDEVHAESVLDEPEAKVSAPDAAALQNQAVGILEENKSLEQSADPRTRRRWVGTDATLCGAINSVRETFPTGTRGVFRYTGSPKDGWRAQFSLRDDEPITAVNPEHDSLDISLALLEELPELLAVNEWLEVFNQAASGGIILEPLIWPEVNDESSPRRRMIGRDQTLCGAINTVRDSYPQGAHGEFEYSGSAVEGWSVRFSLMDDDRSSRERENSRDHASHWRNHRDNRNWQNSTSKERGNEYEPGHPEWEPAGYRQRRERAIGDLKENPWDRYVGSFEPTTANNSRSGLDKFGRNADTGHLGTWRDDL